MQHDKWHPSSAIAIVVILASIGVLSGLGVILYLHQLQQVDDDGLHESPSSSTPTAPRTVYRSRHGFVIEYPKEWSYEGDLEEYSNIAEAEERNRNSFVLYNFPISDVSGGHIEGDQQKIAANIFDFSTPEQATRKLQELVSEQFTDATILYREPIWIYERQAEKIISRDEFGWATTLSHYKMA